jgi:ATP-dependent Clp protease ATP-binding subunit ClpC
MIPCSAGVLMCWQVAANEAVRSRHESIEREHMLIGLCESERITSLPDSASLIAGFGEHLAEELERLVAFFEKQGLDYAKVGHKLRQFLDKGDSQRGESDSVHRSPNCRLAFDEASQLAETHSAEAFNCLHFVAALLGNPGARIAQAIVLGRGDVLKLCQAAQKEAFYFKAQRPKVSVLTSIEEKAKPPSNYLERYGCDLTQLAREGKIEPLIGRKKELLQLTRTLCRKTKNNPLLLGEPGVGKTSIVRNLALQISQGRVARVLQNKRVVEIRLGELVAGTKYRGEFEERLTRILEEAKADPNVMLFFDEIHSMVGAGAGEGALDAANMMKPALASGDLRCIGSTTLSEFRTRIEKDAALARRFQPIMVDEPSPEETLKILAGLKERYEQHHQVSIDTSALRGAVDLACRHIPDRRFPDKALDLIDEACVRVKIGTMSTRESGPQPPLVTWETVAQVVAESTGIPVNRLSLEEERKLRDIRNLLGQRVIGQPEAIEKVCQVVTLSRAGLRNFKRPVGVFLFLGPTGVGKTELAKALAEFLFGLDEQIIRLDMSEFMEKHQISRLIGAPPGYIGHDEEGQLTGRLWKRPYSVVLLDEIEKAHPEVYDLLLQLFDEGRITDSHGRLVDGRNAIFIMTSNIAVTETRTRHVGFEPPQGEQTNLDASRHVWDELRKRFRPEFLNRIDEVVTFSTLSEHSLAGIVRNMLGDLASRCQEQGITLELSEEAISLVTRAGHDPANGARPLARAIERLVARPIGQRLVSGEVKTGDTIRVGAIDGCIVFQRVNAPESADNQASTC